MASGLHFLISDGYSKKSRDELEAAGMQLAWKLYADMLLQHLPDASYDVLLPSDAGSELPTGTGIDNYDGMLWTGCNLTIYHLDDERVTRQIELARQMYKKGVPSFGSCWGIQMAAVAAGGEVKANPLGREMCLARKIWVTDEGRAHPLMAGKPEVFDGFISHLDEVTQLPPGGRLLACGDFTHVQALAVTHEKGTFWATQYHPEYNLHEMARLIVAREPKLVPEGFYRDHDELVTHVDRMEALAADPSRKDLRFQLAVDDDVLSDEIRQREFVNWLQRLVLPTAAERGK